MDFNDDKYMEWSEFTQYIIDSVMMNKSGGPDLEKSNQKKKGQGSQFNKSLS